jgi:hypothetical protein
LLVELAPLLVKAGVVFFPSMPRDEEEQQQQQDKKADDDENDKDDKDLVQRVRGRLGKLQKAREKAFAVYESCWNEMERIPTPPSGSSARDYAEAAVRVAAAAARWRNCAWNCTAVLRVLSDLPDESVATEQLEKAEADLQLATAVKKQAVRFPEQPRSKCFLCSFIS